MVRASRDRCTSKQSNLFSMSPATTNTYAVLIDFHEFPKCVGGFAWRLINILFNNIHSHLITYNTVKLPARGNDMTENIERLELAIRNENDEDDDDFTSRWDCLARSATWSILISYLFNFRQADIDDCSIFKLVLICLLKTVISDAINRD